MTDEVMNPAAVEQAIRDISNRIANGVKVCSERHKAFLTAERDYDYQFALAYRSFDGPAHEKKYAATVETIAFREAKDNADAAYQYAIRQSRALTDELRAMQSVGASIRSMFAVAGRGEGA